MIDFQFTDRIIRYSKSNRYILPLIGASLFLLSTGNIFTTLPYSAEVGPDQPDIERIAQLILDFKPLDQFTWSHGLGYPLLIAPFKFLKFVNPLNAANLLLFTITFVVAANGLVQIVKSSKKLIYLLVILVISFCFSPDIFFWVIGSSNSISASLLIISVVWSIVYKPPIYLPIYLGFLSGLDFSARYIDLFLLSPLIFSALVNYASAYNLKFFGAFKKYFILLSLFILLTLAFHQFYLGDLFATPYDNKMPNVARLVPQQNNSNGEGIVGQFTYRYFQWILPNLYSTLIQPRHFASLDSIGWGKSALAFNPLYFLTPLSLTKIILYFKSYFFRRNISRKEQLKLKRVLYCFVLSLLFWIIFYASSWPYTAHDLKYYCLRYFMGWLTILLFLTITGLFVKASFNSYLIATILYIIICSFPYSFKYLTNYHGTSIEEITVSSSKDDLTSVRHKMPFLSGNQNDLILHIEDDKLLLTSDIYNQNISLLDCQPSSEDSSNLISPGKHCFKVPLRRNIFSPSLKYQPERGMHFISLSKIDLNQYLIHFGFTDDKSLSEIYISDKPFLIPQLSNRIIEFLNLESNRFIDGDPAYSIEPISFVESQILEIDIPPKLIMNNHVNINFDMVNSKDTYFPSLIDIDCLDDTLSGKLKSSCRATKIGRLNNRWSIWIDDILPYESIRILFDSVVNESPPYLPIQSISIR